MSADRYLRDVFSQLRYLATWLPNARVNVGDVGISRSGIFERLTSLTNLSITYKTTKSKSPMSLDATSSSGVEIHTNIGAETIAGSLVAPATAGLTIEFKEFGGFVVQASGCYEVAIEDKTALEADLLTAYHAGEWNDQWLVIETVVQADLATILVSDSDTSTIQFSVSGAVGLAPPLAVAQGSMSIVAQKGRITRFTSERGLTPFYRASRLKRVWWKPLSPPSLSGTERAYVGSEEGEAMRAPTYRLTESTPEDLLVG